MPRNARVLLPEEIYHLTHRCHNGTFLLRSDTIRIEYRRRLRSAVCKFKITVLNYCLTSNHTHLLLICHHPTSISTFMRQLEGEFASSYNRSKKRRGSFWGERYHSTLIEDGSHFWNCMRYIDLNMVRAGVVKHPRDWPWCGYQEIVGLRQRYRIVDTRELIRLGEAADFSTFADWYGFELDRTLHSSTGCRELQWSESIAVGSEAFVRNVSRLFRARKKFVIKKWTDSGWYVRDPGTLYEPTAVP